MEGSKIQIVGPAIGEHGPYTFYKRVKFKKSDRPAQFLSLGEFFFMKLSKNIPVCVGELQLIWTDKNVVDASLCNVRLYFIPENTPDGRTSQHGKNEVLALSDKMVLNLLDLLHWVIDFPSWDYGLKAMPINTPNYAYSVSIENKFVTNNPEISKPDTILQNNNCDSHNGASNVMILSYTQYCRYCAVLRRLENMTDVWLKNTLISALGGINVKQPSYIVFCRDVFHSTQLDNLEQRLDHLAPKLKGRRRKKKSSGDYDSESDSTKTSEIISNKKKTDLSPPGSLMRRVHLNYPNEEKVFLGKLHSLMRKRGTPIVRVPKLGYKSLDLHLFYSSAQKFGGYEKITEKRLWKQLYDVLGGNPGSTSAATCTRRNYEKFLLPYEKFVRSQQSLSPRTNGQQKTKEILADKIKQMKLRVNHNNNHKEQTEKFVPNVKVKKKMKTIAELSREQEAAKLKNSSIISDSTEKLNQPITKHEQINSIHTSVPPSSKPSSTTVSGLLQQQHQSQQHHQQQQQQQHQHHHHHPVNPCLVPMADTLLPSIPISNNEVTVISKPKPIQTLQPINGGSASCYIPLALPINFYPVQNNSPNVVSSTVTEQPARPTVICHSQEQKILSPLKAVTPTQVQSAPPAHLKQNSSINDSRKRQNPFDGTPSYPMQQNAHNLVAKRFRNSLSENESRYDIHEQPLNLSLKSKCTVVEERIRYGSVENGQTQIDSTTNCYPMYGKSSHTRNIVSPHQPQLITQAHFPISLHPAFQQAFLPPSRNSLPLQHHQPPPMFAMFPYMGFVPPDGFHHMPAGLPPFHCTSLPKQTENLIPKQ